MNEMSKLKKIAGENILKSIILHSFIDEKVIGICSDCIDEKVDKPYHFLGGHKEILGVTEVRLPYRGNYKYYNHGLCDRHYEKRKEK